MKIRTKAIPMRVPIIGGAQPQQQGPGVHRYHVSVAIERPDRPVTFDSAVVNTPAPLIRQSDFADVAQWFAQNIAERDKELPPPVKVTVIAYSKLAFIPQDAIERAKAHAETEAQLFGADGKPAEKAEAEP